MFIISFYLLVLKHLKITPLGSGIFLLSFSSARLELRLSKLPVSHIWGLIEPLKTILSYSEDLLGANIL